MAGKSEVAKPTSLDPTLRWLTVEQAALYLQVSPQTIRNLIHGHGLKAIRVGPLLRIDRADIDAWMMRRKVTVAPYRRGTHPWVAKRHAENRKRVRKAAA